jgi:hypothetical protein
MNSRLLDAAAAAKVGVLWYENENMSEKVTPRAIWIGALLLAATAAADSRFSDRPISDRWISDRVEVRLVEVDAVVTDRRGRPVTGLGRDDFELLVDGRRRDPPRRPRPPAGIGGGRRRAVTFPSPPGSPDGPAGFLPGPDRRRRL